MLLNYREYQNACHDLISLALSSFSMNSKNPKVREDFLKQASITLHFNGDRLFLQISYSNNIRVMPLMDLFHEENNRYGFPSSVWELKSLISLEEELALGIRIGKIKNFFEDIMSQAVGDMMQLGKKLHKSEVKKRFIILFYEYFCLNTAKGLSK